MIAQQTTARRALRVPQIAASFWIVKGLSTAMGESTSDYLVHAINPVSAVLLGFGAGLVSVVLSIAIAVCVTYLAITRNDVQDPDTVAAGAT